HFNLPFRLVHQCHHVRTVRRVDRHAFAASYVTHHILAADRVTTSRSVDQQIAMALHPDGVVIVISAKHSPHYAGMPPGFSISESATGSLPAGTSRAST